MGTQGKAKVDKTRYRDGCPEGVYYRKGTRAGTGEEEKVFYIMYRLDGKLIEEKIGRQYANRMTPAKAARHRALRMEGKELPNAVKRKQEAEKKKTDANRPTINRLWEAYKATRPELKGIVSDENRFKNYLVPAFGDATPEEIAPLDVDRLRIRLLKKKSPATVRNVLELLRRIVNFGTKRQLTQGLSFKIELPKLNNLKTEDLSPEQMKALLKAIEEDEHPQAGNIMKMALYTGMRRGEIFKLQWDHVDFDRGFITLVTPKGGKDEKIPLNIAARSLLEEIERTDSSYVFPGKEGRQRTDIARHVRRIRDAAGLPSDYRPLHGLRHAYASMLASSGQVDLYTLQKLMTHKSPMMTQRYAHLRDDALKEAASVADGLFSELEKPGKVVAMKK
jgi:integrase